jgi:hypothetical protein
MKILIKIKIRKTEMVKEYKSYEDAEKRGGLDIWPCGAIHTCTDCNRIHYDHDYGDYKCWQNRYRGCPDNIIVIHTIKNLNSRTCLKCHKVLSKDEKKNAAILRQKEEIEK